MNAGLPPGNDTRSYAPGTSPFRTKGVLFLGTYQYFAQAIPTGIQAVYAQIDDEPLLAFFKQRFLPSSWYDALPVAALIAAEARALHISLAAYLTRRTRWQAEHDIKGIYRAILRFTSGEMIAARLAKVVSQYYDFGTVATEPLGPGASKLTFHGMPASLVYWYSTVSEVYVSAVLEFAGLSGCVVRSLGVAPYNVRSGVATMSVPLEIRWR